VAQQISTRAADAIRNKVLQDLGTEPQSYAGLSRERLQTYGLTKAKAECVIEVARRVAAGELDDLAHLSDHDVAARLRMTKGIGPWTAHMFLVFGLARPDVWPTSDAGLLAAAKRQYGTQDRIALEQLGRRFSPWRSLAAVYLWKSLENTG
jgi:DNA-3-methyladenine glycosylase II